MKFLLKLFTPFFFLLLSFCGDEKARPFTKIETSCDSQSAIIKIFDNFLEATCGCSNLANNTIILSGSSLSCTLSLNSVVFFMYMGQNTPHQITSDGTPSFTSSPPFFPNDHTPGTFIHSYQFSHAGSFQFVDAFDNQISGTFTVP